MSWINVGLPIAIALGATILAHVLKVNLPNKETTNKAALKVWRFVAILLSFGIPLFYLYKYYNEFEPTAKVIFSIGLFFSILVLNIVIRIINYVITFQLEHIDHSRSLGNLIEELQTLQGSQMNSSGEMTNMVERIVDVIADRSDHLEKLMTVINKQQDKIEELSSEVEKLKKKVKK